MSDETDQLDELERRAKENLGNIIANIRRIAELSILTTKNIGDTIDREFSRLLRESLGQIEKEIDRFDGGD